MERKKETERRKRDFGGGGGERGIVQIFIWMLTEGGHHLCKLSDSLTFPADCKTSEEAARATASAVARLVKASLIFPPFFCPSLPSPAPFPTLSYWIDFFPQHYFFSPLTQHLIYLELYSVSLFLSAFTMASVAFVFLAGRHKSALFSQLESLVLTVWCSNT